MARKPVNTVTTFGNEERINDNFIELYASIFDGTATATPAALVTAGEVRGASANFAATCSASALHATGTIIAGGAITGASIAAASANFTATCSAGAFVGASANFTATCSAGSFVGTTLNGAVVDNLAWATYTPTVTPDTGSLTTYTAAGRYKQTGKTVHISIKILLTTVGTAGGNANVTLPATAAAAYYILSGTEVATNGSMLRGVVAPSAALANIVYYNAGSAFGAGNGSTLVIAGTYEAA